MSNHVHFVAVPRRDHSLARVFGRTHADYARYANVLRRGCGHLWRARFYSCPLDEAAAWRALAYVERNPVRAGLVAEAAEYAWSSARAHCTASDAEAAGDARLVAAVLWGALARGAAYERGRGDFSQISPGVLVARGGAVLANAARCGCAATAGQMSSAAR